jgi:acyl-CoA dehydrogenase
MTEPQGGSDPKVFTCRAHRHGVGSWRLNGRKWFSSNARWASFFIVMAVTDTEVPIYDGASMFIVPRERAGIHFIRNTGLIFDAPDEGSEGYIEYRDVPLNDSDLLGGAGDAFKIAQFRLGGGRVHHAMRSVGLAAKAFDMMCERALSRTTQGSPLADKQMVQAAIADCWLQIEQFRLFVLRTAWKIDKYGDYKRVREDIAATKNLAYRVVTDVVTKAIHLHGSLGLSNEMSFGEMLRAALAMGIVDGPSEVHTVTIAKQILRKYEATPGLFPTSHLPARVVAAVNKYHSQLQLPGPKSAWVEYARKLQPDGTHAE